MPFVLMHRILKFGEIFTLVGPPSTLAIVAENQSSKALSFYAEDAIL